MLPLRRGAAPGVLAAIIADPRPRRSTTPVGCDAWIELLGSGGEALAPEIDEELRHVAAFGGHNGFLGGGEKEVAIRAFHRMRRMAGAPTCEALEDYLRSTGEVDAEGVARAGRWWHEVLEGKRHCDYRGVIIRAHLASSRSPADAAKYLTCEVARRA